MFMDDIETLMERAANLELSGAAARKAGETNYARIQQRGPQTLHYCGPVGTHDSMTDVLLARASNVVVQR